MKFLALFLLSFSSFAATVGTLQLKGNVPVNCGITVASVAKATTLDLLNGETAISVGNSTEVCNNANGYTISLTSLNGGKLVDGAFNVPYTIKYGGDTFKSLLTTATVVKTTPSLTAKTTVISSVLVTVPANPNLVNGDYSDIVTITMTSP